MKLDDIKRFTSEGSYGADYPISAIPRAIKYFQKDFNLQLNPDFQRGQSHPNRGAWIEIKFWLSNGLLTDCRTPIGVRGLKSCSRSSGPECVPQPKGADLFYNYQRPFLPPYPR